MAGFECNGDFSSVTASLIQMDAQTEARLACRDGHGRRSFVIAKANSNCIFDDEPMSIVGKKSVRIPSLLSGSFDTPKQSAQRGSDDLRLFEPGKLVKSLQNLAVGFSQPDRGLLQLQQMPHDKAGAAIHLPNCVAEVWRRRNRT